MLPPNPITRARLKDRLLLFLAVCFLLFFLPGACAPKARITSGGPGIETAQLVPYNGPKARIAVTTFEDKTGRGYGRIGEGMAVMFTTALVNSDRFIVLERDLINEVIREQDLAAGGRVKTRAGSPIGEIEGAELLLTGAITEFEPDKLGLGGGVVGLGTLVTSAILHQKGSDMPIGAVTYTESHVALDVRLIDTATSRILAAVSTEGSGLAWGGGVIAEVGGGRSRLPLSFGGFQKTATEKAIRKAIDLAVAAIALKVPKEFFHFTDEDVTAGRMLGFSFLDLPGLSRENCPSRDVWIAASEQEWMALAEMIGLSGPDAVPPVDFTARQVVAISGGAQKEPETSISIEKVVAYPDRVEITASLTGPPTTGEEGNGNEEKHTPEVGEPCNPVVFFHMEKTSLPLTVVWR